MVEKRKGGRVTPRGGAKEAAGTASGGRYTPPIPREYKVSPRWVPVLMFSLLGVGMILIILNYLGVLPGEQQNAYLLAGLGLITAGFIVATRWR